MKKRILSVLIVIFAAVFIYSAVSIADYYITGSKEESSFEQLTQQIIVTEPAASAKDDEVQISEEIPLENIDINKLYELNRDSIGWIRVPGTVIDYPVMHTPDDSQKYLYKNFNGQSSRSGVPFLDDSQTLDSANMFIYGHNMKNGTMFRGLHKYKNRDFLNKNNKVYFKTVGGIAVYSIYAVIETDSASEWYSYKGDISEEIFNDMMSYIDDNAKYKTDAKPQYSDKILTLSTCSGQEEDRLLVIAVKTDEII